MKTLHRTKKVIPESFLDFFNHYHTGPYIAVLHVDTTSMPETLLSRTYIVLPRTSKLWNFIKGPYHIADLDCVFNRKKNRYEKITLAFSPRRQDVLDAFLDGGGRETIELFERHVKVPVEILITEYIGLDS